MLKYLLCPLWDPSVNPVTKKVPKVSPNVPKEPKNFTDKEILMVSGF